jgi:hypothetical protein
MLCALAFSAFAAQGASAATEGLTLFTCKKNATNPTGERFKGEHCRDVDTSVTGEWTHEAIAENTTTEITGTSEVSKLKSTISGIETELQSPVSHILPEVEVKPEVIEKSWVTNAKDPVTGEHYFHGEAWVEYTEVVVEKPAGKGCKVKGGAIRTNKLKFSSKGLKEHTVLFEPLAGPTGVFAEFTVEGCSISALNGIYEVKGTVEGTVDGATLNFTHPTTTAQGKLTLRGQKAGFESSATVKGTDKAAGDKTDTPLSATTVPTP